VPAVEAGGTDEQGKGNGSLMRVLPLALWHRGTERELAADAETQSWVTHGHPLPRVCCALYVLWARRTLDGAANPWAEAVTTLRELYPETTQHRAELEWAVRPDEPPEGHGGGYVADCLRSAHLALGAGTYEQVVKAAIALGNDTDTTACVAGGIAGLRDGIDAIPQRWRDSLRGRALMEPLLRALFS
jgi:ADP-ribosylglycohydrolase